MACVRNEGTEELVLLVTRLAPSGVAPRIDQLNPGNWAFCAGAETEGPTESSAGSSTTLDLVH